MGAVGDKGSNIERWIERHTELCEFFDGRGASPGRGASLLIAPSHGKTTAECLADLVDQALAVYESADFARDPRVFALKIAVTEAILELT